MLSIPNCKFVLRIQQFTPDLVVSLVVTTKYIAAALKNDLQSLVNLRKKWLLDFNTSKTNLLSFNQHREYFLPSIIMAGANQQRNSLRILRVMFSTDM